MAFNAYLVFDSNSKIDGESTSDIAVGTGAIEISDYGFGVSMPTTTSRSDGGGATVGRANFEVFTCSKNVDTSTHKLFELCCKGTDIAKAALHIYRQGAGTEESGVVKYLVINFHHCVITKVTISGGGEELPKESLEFNYGVCEYWYQPTDHETGNQKGAPLKAGWSTIANKALLSSADFSSKLKKPS